MQALGRGDVIGLILQGLVSLARCHSATVTVLGKVVASADTYWVFSAFYVRLIEELNSLEPFVGDHDSCEPGISSSLLSALNVGTFGRKLQKA